MVCIQSLPGSGGCIEVRRRVAARQIDYAFIRIDRTTRPRGGSTINTAILSRNPVTYGGIDLPDDLAGLFVKRGFRPLCGGTKTW